MDTYTLSHSWLVIGILTVSAFGFLGLGVFLYRRRKAEEAEESQPGNQSDEDLFTKASAVLADSPYFFITSDEYGPQIVPLLGIKAMTVDKGVLWVEVGDDSFAIANSDVTLFLEKIKVLPSIARAAVA